MIIIELFTQRRTIPIAEILFTGCVPLDTAARLAVEHNYRYFVRCDRRHRDRGVAVVVRRLVAVDPPRSEPTGFVWRLFTQKLENGRNSTRVPP